MFIENLCHTKGTWAGKPFELIDWQEQIIRDLFGTLKPNGYRQFNTAYIEIPKKQGKSELAAAVALLLTCGDGEERAEVYGCAADRQQASIVFEVAADMVRMCPALNKRVKILASQKRLIYTPTNSFYQVLSAEAYSKHGFNIHGVVFDELHTQPNRKLFDLSGTALMLADAINEQNNGEYHYVYDRSSVRQKRDPKEIGISSVRGGSIVGDHEVLFCGPDEVITLKHTAYSRNIFANGAVNAAVYLAKKEPGLYNMGDMIAAL